MAVEFYTKASGTPRATHRKRRAQPVFPETSFCLVFQQTYIRVLSEAAMEIAKGGLYFTIGFDKENLKVHVLPDVNGYVLGIDKTGSQVRRFNIPESAKNPFLSAYRSMPGGIYHFVERDGSATIWQHESKLVKKTHPQIMVEGLKDMIQKGDYEAAEHHFRVSALEIIEKLDTDEQYAEFVELARREI